MLCNNFLILDNTSPKCNELRGRCLRYNAICIYQDCTKIKDKKCFEDRSIKK